MGYRPRVQDRAAPLDETGATACVRIDSARQAASSGQLLGALWGATSRGSSVAAAAKRLANFGKRHRLSLGGIKVKDLINEGRR